MAESTMSNKIDEKLVELRSELQQLQNKIEYQRNTKKNIEIKQENFRRFFEKLRNPSERPNIDWAIEMNNFKSFKADLDEYPAGVEETSLKRLKNFNSECEKVSKELKTLTFDYEKKIMDETNSFQEEYKEFTTDTDRSAAGLENQLNGLRSKLDDEESQVRYLRNKLEEEENQMKILELAVEEPTEPTMPVMEECSVLVEDCSKASFDVEDCTKASFDVEDCTKASYDIDLTVENDELVSSCVVIDDDERENNENEVDLGHKKFFKTPVSRSLLFSPPKNRSSLFTLKKSGGGKKW